ncbi:MAG: histidine triad (HIT) protein [Acidobacteria bacterium OLB17]|nr:MAG: histidine triad (HIT) protein [Acidobacteria bacterium OLB17]MCZ2392189.1 HIT domain-containing protein [Acidobacteriota bacterium]
MNRETTEDFYCDFALSGKAEIDRVLETDTVLAFHHTRPFWETHIVVVPKRHIDSLLTIIPDDEKLLVELIEAVNTVAGKVVAERGAARVITNLGRYQDSKHLHFHVCSGEKIRPDDR